MKRARPALLTLSLLTLTLATAACSPSIDGAAKADVDRRLAALSGSSQRYAPPASADPVPLAVGQWVTYKFVDDKQQPSLLTLKLVGRDGTSYWYETESDSYYGRTGTRMLVDFGDRRTPNSVSIKAAKIKDKDGKVTEYPQQMIGLMNSMLRGQLGPIAIDWTGMPQEDATVVAGTFARCYKAQTEVSFAGWKGSSLVWGHMAVPLSSMVRSVSDNGTIGELVAFGLSGAQSGF